MAAAQMRDGGATIRLPPTTYTIPVTVNPTPTRLASSFPYQVVSEAYAPDRSAVVFAVIGKSSIDLWTQPLGRPGKASDGQARALIETPDADESVIPCGFSPDGHWLAYSSNATGRLEIYVTDLSARSTQHRVSSDGGTSPCWSKDGRQSFYWNGNTVMAVDVPSGETFTAGTPHKLFDSPVTHRVGYDVARDGTFYVAGDEVDRSSSIVFVSDITANLRSRAKAQ